MTILILRIQSKLKKILFKILTPQIKANFFLTMLVLTLYRRGSDDTDI